MVAVCCAVESACCRFVRPLCVAEGESLAKGKHQTESGRTVSGPLPCTDRVEERRQGNSRSECYGAVSHRLGVCQTLWWSPTKHWMHRVVWRWEPTGRWFARQGHTCHIQSMRAVSDEVTDRLWNNLTVPLLVGKDLFWFCPVEYQVVCTCPRLNIVDLSWLWMNVAGRNHKPAWWKQFWHCHLQLTLPSSVPHDAVRTETDYK